jgi:hypothetical protein
MLAFSVTSEQLDRTGANTNSNSKVHAQACGSVMIKGTPYERAPLD